MDRTKLWGLSPLGFSLMPDIPVLLPWIFGGQSSVLLFPILLRFGFVELIVRNHHQPGKSQVEPGKEILSPQSFMVFISLQMTKDLHTYAWWDLFRFHDPHDCTTSSLPPHFSPSCLPTDAKAAVLRRALGFLSPHSLCNIRGDWDDINPPLQGY